MHKMNCWEFKKCERQPGGNNVEEHGVCRAAVETSTHGINNGINGGRACWVVPDTLCGTEKQGDYSRKLHQCLNCDFYDLVRKEEGRSYMGSKVILKIIRMQSSDYVCKKSVHEDCNRATQCRV